MLFSFTSFLFSLFINFVSNRVCCFSPTKFSVWTFSCDAVYSFHPFEEKKNSSKRCRCKQNLSFIVMHRCLLKFRFVVVVVVVVTWKLNYLFCCIRKYSSKKHLCGCWLWKIFSLCDSEKTKTKYKNTHLFINC